MSLNSGKRPPIRPETLTGLNIAAGRVPNTSVVLCNGHNPAVGTTLVPVSHGGVYRTPQVAAVTTLRIKAGGNANDTAAGSGARSVTLQGLNETGALVSETLATAGASASSATTTTFLRLLKAWVATSGSYGAVGTSSHAADIVIENSAGTADWATISYATHAFGDGTTQIGAYTVPLGYRAFVDTIGVTVDSTKTTDIHFLYRESILDAAAPYQSLRTFTAIEAVSANVERRTKTWFGPFSALTDILPMAKVSSTTSETSLTFEVILEAT